MPHESARSVLRPSFGWLEGNENNRWIRWMVQSATMAPTKSRQVLTVRRLFKAEQCNKLAPNEMSAVVSYFIAAVALLLSHG